ncbi:hypothetical protein GCM10023257_12590 [Streptomyces hyderabadensis]|uniref:Uncharacterized protein n=1 Tax=Streptomyces hyderabadensis TaxID=598549 RepID=A0ABP9HRF7_9ACTN
MTLLVLPCLLLLWCRLKYGLLPLRWQNSYLAGPDAPLQRACRGAARGRWEPAAQLFEDAGQDWERRSLYAQRLGDVVARGSDRWLKGPKVPCPPLRDPNVSEDGDEGVSEPPQAYRQARVGGALIAAVRNVIAQCRASARRAARRGRQPCRQAGVRTGGRAPGRRVRPDRRSRPYPSR